MIRDCRERIEKIQNILSRQGLDPLDLLNFVHTTLSLNSCSESTDHCQMQSFLIQLQFIIEKLEESNFLTACLLLSIRERYLQKIFHILNNICSLTFITDFDKSIQLNRNNCVKFICQVFKLAFTAKIREIGISFRENNLLQQTMKEHEQACVLNRLLESCGYHALGGRQDHSLIISFKTQVDQLKRSYEDFFLFEQQPDQQQLEADKEDESIKHQKELRKQILSKLILDPNHIVRQKQVKLGQGQYGEVYVGRYRSIRSIAIKQFQPDHSDLDDIHRELIICHSLGSHPNITKVIGYLSPISDDDSFQMIMELATYGTLSTIIYEKYTFPSIPPICLLLWLRNIIHGIEYLHSKDIRHSDIKSENILIYNNYIAKLCDFGFSKQIILTKAGDSSPPIGTCSFMAPEICKSQQGDKSCDIFSFGMTIVQIILRKLPRRERNQIEHCFDHSNWTVTTLTEQGFNKLQELIGCATSNDPTLRPTATIVLDELNEIIQLIFMEQQQSLDTIWKSSYLSEFINIIDKHHQTVSNDDLVTTNANNDFRDALELWFTDQTTAIDIYGHISEWDTSQVADMANAFKDRSLFNEDISHWNVSKVTTMSSMFHGATSFNQSLNRWDVTAVADMSNMFQHAVLFDQPVSMWDMSHVKNVDNMFNGAHWFSEDLTTWAIAPCTDVSSLFGDYRVLLEELQGSHVSLQRYYHYIFCLVILVVLKMKQNHFNEANSLLTHVELVVLQQLRHWCDIECIPLCYEHNDTIPIRTLTLLAHLFYLQYKFSIAKQFFEQLLNEIQISDVDEMNMRTLNILFCIGQVHLQEGEVSKALQIHEDCFTKCVNCCGMNHRLTMQSLCAIAEIYRLQGEYATARAKHEECYRLRYEVFGNSHCETILSMQYLANLCVMNWSNTDKERGYRLQELSLTKSKATFGDDHPLTLAAHTLASYRMCLERKPREALNMICNTISMQTRILGETHMDTITSQLIHAKICAQFGYDRIHPFYYDTMPNVFQSRYADEATKMFTQALDIYTTCLTIFKQRFGEIHPITLNVMAQLAELLYFQKKYDDSKTLVQNCLRFQTPNYALALHFKLVDIAICERRFQDALTMLNECQTTITNAIHQDASYYKCLLLLRFGYVYDEQNRYDVALHYYGQAYENHKMVLGYYHIDTVKAKWKIACIHANKNDAIKALHLFEEYMIDITVSYESHDPTVWIAGYTIASYRKQCGRRHDALKLLDECKRDALYYQATLSDSEEIDTCKFRICMIMNMIAFVNYDLGGYDCSLTLFTESIASLRQLLTNYENNLIIKQMIEFQIILPLYHCGLIYKDKEQFSEALQSLEEVDLLVRIKKRNSDMLNIYSACELKIEVVDVCSEEFGLSCVNHLDMLYDVVNKTDKIRSLYSHFYKGKQEQIEDGNQNMQNVEADLNAMQIEFKNLYPSWWNASSFSKKDS